MGKTYWIADPRAKGGGFFAETLDIPGVKTRAKKGERFVMMPLSWLASMLQAAGTPGAMVCILLRYLSWKTKSQTFPLSTALITKYGINRETKRRVLAKLETAGKIKIQHRHKQAPIITLLG
jgi:hypothetical protein